MKLPKKLFGSVTFHVSFVTFSQPLTTSEPLMTTFSPARGLIDDALRLGRAAARRIDALAIDAFVDGDDIARLRQVRGALDRADRGGFVA